MCLYVISRCSPRNLYYNTSNAQSFLSFIDLEETKLRISRQNLNFFIATRLCRPLLEVLHLDPTSFLDGTNDDGTGLTRASNALEGGFGLVTVGESVMSMAHSIAGHSSGLNSRSDNDDHSNSHVERPSHLEGLNVTRLHDPLPNSGQLPRLGVNRTTQVGSRGEDSRNVFRESTSGDVRHSL